MSSPAKEIDYFAARSLDEKLAANSDNITHGDFTPESVASFLTTAANRVISVAEVSACYPAPWRLSPIEDQKGMLIAPDNRDGNPYVNLSAATSAKICRIFVAAEPWVLTERAEVFKSVASSETSGVKDNVLRIALRWNASMKLNCQKLLEGRDGRSLEDIATPIHERRVTEDDA